MKKRFSLLIIFSILIMTRSLTAINKKAQGISRKDLHYIGVEFLVKLDVPFLINDMEKIRGIYKIENIKNGKVYIGQSINCIHRIKYHKNKLYKNDHNNKHLQSAYNKYKRNNFIFEIIEKIKDKRKSLTKREQYWINYFDAFDEGYNQRPVANSTAGFKYSKEVCQKMSKSRKGHIVTAKTRKKISDANKGNKHTKKSLKQMSINLKKHYKNNPAKKRSKKVIEKIKKGLAEYYKIYDGSWKGKKHSEKSIQKMKKSQTQYYKTHSHVMKGTKTSNKIKNKISKTKLEYFKIHDHHRKGSRQSIEARNKMSKSKKGILTCFDKKINKFTQVSKEKFWANKKRYCTAYSNEYKKLKMNIII